MFLGLCLYINFKSFIRYYFVIFRCCQCFFFTVVLAWSCTACTFLYSGIYCLNPSILPLNLFLLYNTKDDYLPSTFFPSQLLSSPGFTPSVASSFIEAVFNHSGKTRTQNADLQLFAEWIRKTKTDKRQLKTLQKWKKKTKCSYVLGSHPLAFSARTQNDPFTWDSWQPSTHKQQ